MKKIYVSLICIFLIFNLLSCTNNTSSAIKIDTNKNSNTSNIVTSYSSSEVLNYDSLWPGKTKLVWVFHNFMNIPKDVVTAFNNELVKQGCDYVVQFVCPDFNSYYDIVKGYKTQNSQVDLLNAPLANGDVNENSTNIKAVQNGLFYDISKELLSSKGNALYSAFSKVFWQTNSINGKVYGVGLTDTVSQKPELIFNKQLLTQYGLKASDFSDPASMVQSLEKINFSENSSGFSTVVYNSDMGNNVYIFSEMELLENVIAVKYSDNKPTAVNQYKDKNYVQFLTVLNNLVKKKYITESGYSKNCTELLSNGQYFLYLTVGNGLFGDYTLSNYKGGCEEIPINDGFALHSPNNMTGIASWSENKDKALELLTKVNTDATLSNILRYGIEGTHYKIDNGRAIPISNASEKYNGIMAPVNKFITLPSNDEPTKKADAFKQEIETARRAPTGGFVLDTSAIADKLKALQPIVAEADKCWQNKDVDMDAKLAEINEKLKNAGLDEVLAEVNRQLTAWWNSKGEF